ncbi:hypothetical protein GJAV_G00259950 [Gymnothorax javanicus]|nr:hypothetical protein GJAV_G00259950 [Gymnothorax javanicus]
MRFLLIMCVWISVLIGNHKCTPEHDQVFSITPITEEEVTIIRNVSSNYETVLWQPAAPGYIRSGMEVHLFIPANSLETVQDLLRENRLDYKVLLENTQELIDKQTKNDSSDPRSSQSYYERYHPLEDIYNWINKTKHDHPEMVDVILIGSSYEKRPLFVLKISGKGGVQPKRAMWMDCGIHAREWISPAFCLWFVHYAIDYYGMVPDITEILDSMDVYVLPVMNPDGYKYTWTTNRMWRKNRSWQPGNYCPGTDLNRNFDANWCTEGASSRACDETYCGLFPESEPEAQAVANFLRKQKQAVKLYLSIHSYSQMLLFPYSCSYQQASNHHELAELAQEAAEKKSGDITGTHTDMELGHKPYISPLVVLMTGPTTLASNTPSPLSSRTEVNTASCCPQNSSPQPARRH